MKKFITHILTALQALFVLLMLCVKSAKYTEFGYDYTELESGIIQAGIYEIGAYKFNLINVAFGKPLTYEIRYMCIVAFSLLIIGVVALLAGLIITILKKPKIGSCITCFGSLSLLATGILGTLAYYFLGNRDYIVAKRGAAIAFFVLIVLLFVGVVALSVINWLTGKKAAASVSAANTAAEGIMPYAVPTVSNLNPTAAEKEYPLEKREAEQIFAYLWVKKYNELEFDEALAKIAEYFEENGYLKGGLDKKAVEQIVAFLWVKKYNGLAFDEAFENICNYLTKNGYMAAETKAEDKSGETAQTGGEDALDGLSLEELKALYISKRNACDINALPSLNTAEEIVNYIYGHGLTSIGREEDFRKIAGHLVENAMTYLHSGEKVLHAAFLNLDVVNTEQQKIVESPLGVCIIFYTTKRIYASYRYNMFGGSKPLALKFLQKRDSVYFREFGYCNVVEDYDKMMYFYYSSLEDHASEENPMQWKKVFLTAANNELIRIPMPGDDKSYVQQLQKSFCRQHRLYTISGYASTFNTLQPENKEDYINMINVYDTMLDLIKKEI